MDFKNNEWFIIKDIDELTNSARALVFSNFGKSNQPEETDDLVDDLLLEVSPEDQKELDSVLSYSESLIIVKQHIKKQIHKKTDKIRYVMNDKMFLTIIESLNDRMTSNLLNSLVNRGLIETAYDDKSQDFIFWVKENKNK
jgi:tRNA G10  N-methylase Trm11